MSTVLAIVGTTAITYTTSGARTASRSTADQKAYALAEAGVNDAMAVLSLPSNNALDPYLLPTQTVTYDGGTVTYAGTLDLGTGTWTITATGAMRNPTGPHTSPVQRTLGVNVGVDPSYSQPLNNMAWNYIWAKATGSTCDMTIGQSVNVATPLYVEGNLCLQNSATISSGPLVVKGALSMNQKGNGVGQPSNPINEAHVGGACQYWNKSADYPCKGNQGSLYVSGTILIKNTKLCAAADGSGNCDPTQWDPNSRLLVLVADGKGGQVPASDSIQLVSGVFQGALYGTNAIENDTTSSVIGPMIASTVILGQSVTTSFPAIRIVPVGMPALQNTIYAQPRAPTGYTG